MERINKRVARKLFNEGKMVWITACNMRPEQGLLMNAGTYENELSNFDTFVNSFTYYNCNNETGRYPAFYIE